MYPYFLAADIFLQNEKGEILLLKRDKNKRILGGFYNGIGGKFKAFETPADAIRREVQEEIGVTKIKNVKLKTLLTVHDKFGPWLIFCYTGKIRKNAINRMNISEGTLEWVKKTELTRKRLVPDLMVWHKKLFKEGISYFRIEYDHRYRMKSITPSSAR